MDNLIPPHGSTLVDLMVTDERAGEIRERSRDWPSVDLGPRQLCDLELLLNGGYSPLEGYIGSAEHDEVCCDLPSRERDSVAAAGDPRRLEGRPLKACRRAISWRCATARE